MRSAEHGFEVFLLRNADATATVIPSRGGIVSRLRLGEDELFALDAATLEDRSKNVRGGVPILFPFPGKPPAGSTLKQHGFARTMPWRLQEESDARVRCVLEPDAATRAAFGHEFRLSQQVSLSKSELTLQWTLDNRGEGPMPLHFGIHPYFFVPQEQKASCRVDTQATRAFDNRTGKTGPVPALDFSGPELDLHLLDPGPPRTVLHRGHLKPIALEWSPNFTTLVLWTLPGHPFVCVEPWSAPAGTLGQRTLAAGASELFSFSVRLG